MRKRVLLFHPPTDLGYSVLTPLGLAAIHAATPEGYETRVLDATLKRWRDLDEATFDGFDIVGISVRYTYNVRKVKAFIRLFSERFPDKPVIAGGSHATYDAEGLLRAGARFVVRNMGEGGWRSLLAALRDGRGPANLANVAFLEDGEVRQGPDGPFSGPNDWPTPTHEVFRAQDYPFPMGMHAATLETSRGCPNRCRFCTNPLVWRGRWEGKEIPRITDEMDRLERLGFSFAFLADDNFGLDPDHRESLFDALARRPRRLPFMAEVQPRTIGEDPSWLARAWDAGMRIVSLDTNTIDEDTRRFYGRTDDLETIRRALDAVRRSRIASVSNVIVGAPGESIAAMKRDIRFAQGHADVFSCGTLEPRPGNRFWSEAFRDQTDRLGRGEALLHEDPAAVRRIIHWALIGYYFRPRQVLRSLFGRKVGVRILMRLHYVLYANAALNKFLGLDRTAEPTLGSGGPGERRA